jgi:uncharacterized protein
MMNRWKYILPVFFCMEGMSQNIVISRVDPLNRQIVNVKWYCEDFLNVKAYNIYRRESSGSSWTKLNKEPFRPRSYRPPKQAYDKDKDLKAYISLVSEPSGVKGLAFLAVLIKSFKDETFSRHLGLWYDDSTALQGMDYEYRITVLTQNSEKEAGLSKPLRTGRYLPEEPPRQIESSNGRNAVAFKWLPETERYFGMNIFRKDSAQGEFKKVNADPVIISRIKNEKAEDVYGETFYLDQNLAAGKYEYALEAVDFFGSAGRRSEIIVVILKDTDAPSPPDSLKYAVNGRKVQISWHKSVIENDLAGFNIYRTNKNDTDFTRLNTELIPVTEPAFTDSVPRFSSFMYKVAAVDTANNEGHSHPYMVEVYDNEPPAKPEGLHLSADSGKIILNWKANSEPDLEGYLVYRTINANHEDTYVKLTPVPVKENYFEDQLAANTKNKFLYKIVAVDQSMNRSRYSEFAEIRLPDLTAPSAPFLKSVSQSERNYTLIEWFANAEPDLAGYSIFRKDLKNKEAIFAQLNQKLVGSGLTRFTDRNAEPGMLYEYFIRAVDSSGNISVESNHCKFRLSVEGRDNAGFSEFNLKYNTRRNMVELRWKMNTRDSLRGFVVYRSADHENELRTISGLLDDNKISDKEVRKNTGYVYQVRAYDMKGDVIRSEKIKIITTEK